MSLWFLIWPDSPSWPSLECQFVPYQEALFPLQHNPQIWHVSPVLWGQHSCSFQWPSVFCLCTGKQGGTPEKISRSPELSKVLYFTRCITEQSFSVKPSLSAPDYHPVLPFSFKYTKQRNRETSVDSSSCTEGVEYSFGQLGSAFLALSLPKPPPAFLLQWQSEKGRRCWCFGSTAQQ